MLNIEKIDHIGIRISDIKASISFYEDLGFKKLLDAGYAEGHPVILEHPSGVVLNLLGPSNKDKGTNVLMDIDARYSGITHFSLRIPSVAAAQKILENLGIEITGSFQIGEVMSAIFFRDPDRNVIELDEVASETARTEYLKAYTNHP